MSETPTTPAIETPAEPVAAPVASSILATAAPGELPTPTPEPKSVAETLYPEGEKPIEAAPEGEKPAEEVKPEDKVEAKPETPAAPLTLESYVDLIVPSSIAFSEPILAAAKDLFVEAGIAPEVGQKLLDFYAQAQADITKSTSDAWAATQSQWTESINTMPEFQGERRARSEAVLGRAMEEYGNPEAREFFKMTGDNPGVVKLILSMAEALTEGEPTPQGGAPKSGTAKRSMSEILYPTPSQ